MSVSLPWITSHQCGKCEPISNPWAGKDTGSTVFLLLLASNRFKCRQRIFGNFAKVCCFRVGVFMSQDGQCTGSVSVSGQVKCSKQTSTEIFTLLAALFLVPIDTVEESRSDFIVRSISFASGRDMFKKGSGCDLLHPHLSHMSTDRNVASYKCFTISRGSGGCRTCAKSILRKIPSWIYT